MLEAFTASPHLGETSSVSPGVRSMLVVLTSLRLTGSAGAAGATGSSSSSSWVGCLEQIRVSSVIQLKVRGKDSR